MNDPYYDGAHDALTEVMSEVKAAFLMGYSDIKRRDYPVERDFWVAITVRAIEDLQSSYERDAKFVAALKEKQLNEASAGTPTPEMPRSR